MQLSPINNKKLNFKAKLEISIGQDFISHLKSRWPMDWPAEYASDILTSVKLLKKVAPNIGRDEDIIKLKTQESWIELFYNNKKFYDDICPPRTWATSTVSRFVKYITKEKINLFEMYKPRTYYAYKPIENRDDLVTRTCYYISGRKIKSDVIDVNKLIDKVKRLDTKT